MAQCRVVMPGIRAVVPVIHTVAPIVTLTHVKRCWPYGCMHHGIMWRMSDIEAALFVAVVAMVALAVMAE
jgi:hypothetical protein